MVDGVMQAETPEISALRALLASAGVEETAAFALGLSGGAGFIATTARATRKAPYRLHVSGWNSFQSNIVGAIDRLGMVASFDETNNARAAARSLEAALAGGGPVALWIDGAVLGLGADVAPPFSDCIVLATAEPGGAIEVVAADGVRHSVDPGTISAARASIAAHRNRLLTVQPAVERPDAPVRAALATMAVGSIGGPRGKTGPDGVKRLARAIDGRGFGDWRSIFDGGWPLLEALVALASSVQREQGLFRAPQATFERSAAASLEIPALTAVADAHDALAQQWLGVADRALPVGLPALAPFRDAAIAGEPAPVGAPDEPFPLSKTELDELLAGLSKSVDAVAVAETAALALLRSTLRSN